MATRQVSRAEQMHVILANLGLRAHLAGTTCRLDTLSSLLCGDIQGPVDPIYGMAHLLADRMVMKLVQGFACVLSPFSHIPEAKHSPVIVLRTRLWYERPGPPP